MRTEILSKTTTQPVHLGGADRSVTSQPSVWSLNLACMDRSSISRANGLEPNLSAPSPSRKRKQPNPWRNLRHSPSAKLLDSPRSTGMSSLQEIDTFYEVHHLPKYPINHMARELSSANSLCHYSKDDSWGPYSSNMNLSNRHSPSNTCHLLDLGEAHNQSSRSTIIRPTPSDSACTSCIDEDPDSTVCQTPDETKCDWSSVCIDPDCYESVCEECCQDCVEDCGSDCGVPIHHEKVDLRTNDYYSCDGSFSELFGDQAAELFDLDGRLPQLPMDNMPIESIEFGLFSDDAHADIATFSKHIIPGSPFAANHQLRTSSMPIQLRSQSQLPDPDEAVCIDGGLALGLEPNVVYSSSQSVNLNAENAAEDTNSTQNTPSSLDWGSSSDGRTITSSPTSSNANTAPSIACQWADSKGHPCNRAYTQGDDLHEHLKAAHGVRSEVLCRWMGCRVGVHGASPHQYANSVERHTWGHSGYRPYKCPTCAEGFAAAKLRDEHFTSLHLGKKTFCCDVCSHQCTSATNLKRHKDDKHRTGRFQCEFCNRLGKVRLFPRGPNLARHFRKCKAVLARYPEAINAETGKMDDAWLPPGYKKGHHGMDQAKIIPPHYLPLSNGGWDGPR